MSRKLVLNTGLPQGCAVDDMDSMEGFTQNQRAETEQQPPTNFYTFLFKESKWNRW